MHACLCTCEWFRACVYAKKNEKWKEVSIFIGERGGGKREENRKQLKFILKQDFAIGYPFQLQELGPISCYALYCTFT